MGSLQLEDEIKLPSEKLCHTGWVIKLPSNYIHVHLACHKLIHYCWEGKLKSLPSKKASSPVFVFLWNFVLGILWCTTGNEKACGSSSLYFEWNLLHNNWNNRQSFTSRIQILVTGLMLSKLQFLNMRSQQSRVRTTIQVSKMSLSWFYGELVTNLFREPNEDWPKGLATWSDPSK